MNNRDNFQWRPNDNSSKTNLRYQLEAEKWTRAFNAASAKRPVSSGNSFAVIGMVISLIYYLILFILICLADFVKWVLVKRGEYLKRKEEKAVIRNTPPVVNKIYKSTQKKHLSDLEVQWEFDYTIPQKT